MKAFPTWRGRLQAVALTSVAIGLVTVASVAARQPAPGQQGGPGMRARCVSQMCLSGWPGS